MNAAFSSILFLLSVSLQEETFISTILSKPFLSSFLSLISSSCQFSFSTYIRNLALQLKYNKGLGDFVANRNFDVIYKTKDVQSFCFFFFCQFNRLRTSVLRNNYFNFVTQNQFHYNY